MAYVITSLCERDGACADICPEECIVPGPMDDFVRPSFYIDPDSCIDCGVCARECPVGAIFPEDEVPAEYSDDIGINAGFFQ